MAKKNQVFIDIVIDDQGTTKRVAVNAKKLGIALDDAGVATDRAAKGTDKLGRSSKDLDRNMRGTAKMTSNGTKEFSKMQQGMGGLVGAYATLAAQVFAVSAAFQFLSRASEIANLIEGQRAMGNVTGVAYATITERVIEATDAQLKYGDAARAAAIGTAAGLQAGQLTELANAAKNASFALGRDLTDSFNRLIRGVTKAEPELLDELGIILRLETATQKYAQSIGKARQDLNEYERTQAVTNEVLEQAQRKFAAIEAQMDPNAAALAQFAKSFDDLVRGFQEALITQLRPILSFLSENTAALTAALTLFALPIVRAILPSLDDWQASTQKLEKRNRRFFNSYKKGLKNSGKELNTFIKTQKQLEKSATKSARKILEGTQSSAGVDFLRGQGESGDRRKQAAAKRIIQNALEQLKTSKVAETGFLAGKNEEQVLGLQRSYDARVNAANAANKKTMLSFAFAFKVIKGGILGVQTVWQGAMLFMARAATIAAVAINFAFKATAIIGVITLLFEAGKLVYRFFVPLTEQQKRNIAIVEELDGAYEKLTQQMEGARKARDTLLAGSGRQINIGNILASADLEEIISRINLFTTLDKDADGYENIQNQLKGLVAALVRIDPKFASLNKNIEDGSKILPNQAKSVRILANEYIDLGVRLQNVPNLVKDANDAFASLSKSINNTPLSNVVDRTAKAITGLELEISEAQKSSEAFTKELDLAKEIDKEIAVIEKRMGTLSQMIGDRKKLEKLRDPEIGFMTVEDQEALVQTQEQTVQLLNDSNTQLQQFQRRLEFATTKEQALLKLRQQSLKVSIIDARARLEGNDIFAKTNNLEEERNKSRQKLVAANEKVIQAEVAIFELEGEKLKTGKEKLEAAKLNLQLVKAEVNFEQTVLDVKQKQLALELRMLNVSKQQRALDLARGQDRRNLVRSQAVGGGTDQAIEDQRKLNRRLLENAVAGAKLQVQRAQEARDLEADRLRDRVGNRVLREEFGGSIGDFNIQTGDFERGAQFRERREEALSTAVGDTTQGRALTQAQEALKDAENLLEIDKDKLLTFKNQNLQLVQQAEKQLQIVGFTQAHVMFNERIVEAKRMGVELDEEDLELLKQQSIAATMLAEIASQKQQLFFSIGDSIATAFTSIIDGSMSAKDAFKQMAKSILADILSMVVRLTVMRALMSFMPFDFGAASSSSSGQAGGFAIGFRTGGIFEQPKGYRMGGKVKDYSTGGIARGPDHGYPAVLHGREAVVPLPSGDKIPVDLQGAGAQQNNVTVNVSVNNDGTATTNVDSSTGGMENLGRMVAKAVQDELVEQKRAGGILSPYGAM